MTVAVIWNGTIYNGEIGVGERFEGTVLLPCIQ
jgi:hypothetical protein